MERNAKRGATRERVYGYVRDRLMSGAPPTVREVQERFGFKAFQTAHAHLNRLVAEGRLVKRPGAARGYALPGVEASRRTLRVPILGQVQAGALREAIEDWEGEIAVVGSESESLFGLRVRGESMIGVGLYEGDVVVARRQSSAETGDIVVALVDGEATVKTLRFLEGRPVLVPENPDFEPIFPDPEALTILGKVVESRRYFERGREG